MDFFIIYEAINNFSIFKLEYRSYNRWIYITSNWKLDEWITKDDFQTKDNGFMYFYELVDVDACMCTFPNSVNDF